ncbi:MAG: hydrogenase nickel incorporation protein HypB [Deltaproteobacteria bacterium]|nr:hydrogenase nickel incorporation protein HypB [Deltaproteobacteria bacterium]
MHDILIEEKILSENDAIAHENRRAFIERGVFVINMVSAPGAGKTSLIEKMTPLLLEALGAFAVVVGDLEGDLDAVRIAGYGVPVRQITTGRACHLDAHDIAHALQWALGQNARLLIIENVGNMVCPAEYDLGEDMMVTVLSVAEGDDKPLKYPAIFNASGALIINKIDLAAHTDFDIPRARRNALAINPALQIFETSCRTGDGIEEWCAFLASKTLARRPKADTNR